LSGTLETEKRIVELRNEKERLRSEKKQIKNEAERIKNEAEQIKKDNEQIKKDNERLAVLESKIDGLFLKYNIGFKVPQKPDQP
jgi:DNA repair exonuclease SbcCD ATPase subunit